MNSMQMLVPLEPALLGKGYTLYNPRERARKGQRTRTLRTLTTQGHKGHKIKFVLNVLVSLRPYCL
jgi:hypothetical protein